MKTPKRLAKNPIIDATAEVRFTSTIPNDAVIGLVYASLQQSFGKPENLPILQIPTALRENDSNLKYQPCYKFTKPGNVLMVGPHTIALATYPYLDWGTSSPLLKDVVSCLNKANLFERVERIGLRYVNFFPVNIFDRSTLTLEVRRTSIAGRSLTLKTEEESKGFKIVTQISNDATAQVAGEPKKGSILDLDIQRDALNMAADVIPDRLMDLFLNANELADEAFFALLSDEFINTFGPEY
jgi:uncharacterized protein (TIGR04255 family)